MKTRLLFSVALIAVLVCFWIIMSKPSCRDSYVAAIGKRLDWTCVPENP
jgi:hypothetical protein